MAASTSFINLTERMQMMDQTFYDRVTRQTHVRRLLQKAVLNLCQKNYAACAPNLEVDGIICISFPDSPDQHVVKIHEKIQLDNVKSGISYDRFGNENEAMLSKVQRSSDNGIIHDSHQNARNESRIPGDRDSMQNSYFNENHSSATPYSFSRNPVFPKMIPSSVPSTKTNDSESHSTRSKRKMFKVVQRKRHTIEEPEVLSSSSNDSPIVTSERSEVIQEIKETDKVCSQDGESEQNFLSDHKKTNYSESVQDGYVIVKVESFDEEENDIDSIYKNRNSQKTNENKREFEYEKEPTRQWIQLPSQNDNDDLLSQYKSKTRESLITIDGKRPDHSEGYESFSDDSHAAEGNYRVRPSVGQIDLSQTSQYGDRLSVPRDKDYDTFDYHRREVDVQDSSVFPNRTCKNQTTSSPSFVQNVLHKNRSLFNKGIKTLDSLYLNKCAKEQKQTSLQQKKTSYEPMPSNLQDKHVSMIDLQGTTSASEKNKPVSYNIAINTDTDSLKEKKYFCRHCGKGFTLKCTRSRHEKTICGGGGEGQYRCHLCQKLFTRSDSRCRHLWKTHGVKSASEITSMC